MANPSRPLEVVIKSAERLENVNHFTTMKPYAVVYMWDTTNNLRSSKEISSAVEGGSNPRWDFKVKFNIDMAEANKYALFVKLRSCRRTHGARDKDIGVVLVPIKDLRDGAERNESEMQRPISRSVDTSSDGSSGTEQEQGVLTLSYKFKEPTADNPTQVNIAKKSTRQAIKKAAKYLGKLAVGGVFSGLTGGLVHEGVQ